MAAHPAAPGDPATNAIVEYFKASRNELAKVTWPTRRTTARLTILVILFSLAFAVFLGALDKLFSEVIQKIIIKG